MKNTAAVAHCSAAGPAGAPGAGVVEGVTLEQIQADASTLEHQQGHAETRMEE
jgi:hypothetical protein